VVHIVWVRAGAMNTMRSVALIPLSTTAWGCGRVCGRPRIRSILFAITGLRLWF